MASLPFSIHWWWQVSSLSKAFQSKKDKREKDRFQHNVAVWPVLLHSGYTMDHCLLPFLFL